MKSYKNLKTSRQIITEILESKPSFEAESIDLIYYYGEGSMFSKVMVDIMKVEGSLTYSVNGKSVTISKV